MDGGILPRRHESRTDDLLSNPLAATGPKAASAACHYPFRDNCPRTAGRVVTDMLRAISATLRELVQIRDPLHGAPMSASGPSPGLTLRVGCTFTSRDGQIDCRQTSGLVGGSGFAPGP